MARLARVALAAVLLASSAGCLEKADEHRLRANAYLRGNDAAAALKECDAGLAARPNNVPLLILKGKALFELEQYGEAKAAYARALEAGKDEDPRSLSEAHLGLAMTDSRAGDWAGAKTEFLALVATNDRDASSHLNVARACLELHDMPCALEHGEAAARLRGNEENVLFTLGTIYAADGKLEEAEKTFQHICEVVPRAASCPYGLALVASKRGKLDDAFAELGKAVDAKLPNPGHIAEDPGFAALHADPRFAALVARAEAPK